MLDVHFGDLPTCFWSIDSGLTAKDFRGRDKWADVCVGSRCGLDAGVRQTRAVACAAVSLPDRWDALRTGSLSFDDGCSA